MTKRLFYGDSADRNTWKNSHRKYLKLSKYKIEKILDCFVRDLTISEAYKELSSSRKKEPISEKTSLIMGMNILLKLIAHLGAMILG